MLSIPRPMNCGKLALNCGREVLRPVGRRYWISTGCVGAPLVSLRTRQTAAT
jgi:hypothetical protein